MRNLKSALSGDTPASQYGVLAGLRVTLHSGLIAPMNKPTSMPAPPRHCTLFHRHEGRSQTGTPLHCATSEDLTAVLKAKLRRTDHFVGTRCLSSSNQLSTT